MAILCGAVSVNFYNSMIFREGGEWHGLAVSVEACHSKGRGIESRSFSFFSFSRKKKNCKSTKGSLKRRDLRESRRSGERKKKNRQAFQDESSYETPGTRV